MNQKCNFVLKCINLFKLSPLFMLIIRRPFFLKISAGKRKEDHFVAYNFIMYIVECIFKSLVELSKEAVVHYRMVQQQMLPSVHLHLHRRKLPREAT